MIIILGADHNGFESKNSILSHLLKRGYKIVDVSDNLQPGDDYPLIAQKVVNELKQNSDAKAILICGSGQGMVMAANRFNGVRAGLGWSREAAKSIRNDENANLIAVPALLYTKDSKLGNQIIDDFLSTPYANAPRYNRRIIELDNLN
ncbi:MAG: RpiB/LacA/LacB family sugar-phosphate isomerase [Patescibacteria group bacterium]|jgi:ribose 5-phosphate isomerase B|nr:RpiB/LacA/LacB family sugar-phosphate isomerase [Patescibacteria group bacterium]